MLAHGVTHPLSEGRGFRSKPYVRGLTVLVGGLTVLVERKLKTKLTGKFRTNVRMPPQFAPPEREAAVKPGDRYATGLARTVPHKLGEESRNGSFLSRGPHEHTRSSGRRTPGRASAFSASLPAVRLNGDRKPPPRPGGPGSRG